MERHVAQRRGLARLSPWTDHGNDARTEAEAACSGEEGSGSERDQSSDRGGEKNQFGTLALLGGHLSPGASSQMSPYFEQEGERSRSASSRSEMEIAGSPARATRGGGRPRDAPGSSAGPDCRRRAARRRLE